jgi:hypothetical protein
MGEETEGRYIGGEMEGKRQRGQTYRRDRGEHAIEEIEKKEGERKGKGSGRVKRRKEVDAGERLRRRNIREVEKSDREEQTEGKR